MSTRFNDLSGQRFGKWTVLRVSGKDARRQIMYSCRCDCGIEKIIRGTALMCKKTTNCGCWRRKWTPDGNAVMCILRGYLDSSESKGLGEWGIDLDVFISILKAPCYYCGQTEQNLYRGFKYNGLDRVDNNKGYVLDNVVPCCWTCNNMKKAMTRFDFVAHVSKIFRNLTRKLEGREVA